MTTTTATTTYEIDGEKIRVARVITEIPASTDDTITLPDAILILADGRAVAGHVDEGDVVYADLDYLAAAYRLAEEVR